MLPEKIDTIELSDLPLDWNICSGCENRNDDRYVCRRDFKIEDIEPLMRDMSLLIYKFEKSPSLAKTQMLIYKHKLDMHRTTGHWWITALTFGPCAGGGQECAVKCDKTKCIGWEKIGGRTKTFCACLFGIDMSKLNLNMDEIHKYAILMV